MIKPFLREVRARLQLLSGRRYRPTVLMYHSIGRNAASFTVSPEQFRRQMELLKARGITVLPLETCVQRALAGDTGRFCALTFDDGYRDFFEEAAPVLADCGFPATIFLITGKMGETYTTSSGVTLPLMTWDQTRELSRRPGFSFGSHTVSHRKLHVLPPEEVRRELLDSRETLVTEMGIKTPGWLCYPRGRYTEEVQRIAGEAGYLGAVTIERGHPAATTNRFAVPRAAMHASMSLHEFEACLL